MFSPLVQLLEYVLLGGGRLSSIHLRLRDLSRRQFPILQPVKFSVLQLLPMPPLARLDMSRLEKSGPFSHIPSLQVFYRLLRHIFPELVPTRDTVQCLAVQSPLLVCGLHNGEVSHIQLLLI